jgi:hypothetical protein
MITVSEYNNRPNEMLYYSTDKKRKKRGKSNLKSISLGLETNPESFSICICCEKPIKGSNKLILKNENVLTCLVCKNYYRKHCLFFGYKCKTIQRYDRCDKYMGQDKMIINSIPNWMRNVFFNNKDDKIFKLRSYYEWRCENCNINFETAYDLFSNLSCIKSDNQEHKLNKQNKVSIVNYF